MDSPSCRIVSSIIFSHQPNAIGAHINCQTALTKEASRKEATLRTLKCRCVGGHVSAIGTGLGVRLVLRTRAGQGESGRIEVNSEGATYGNDE